MNCVNARRSAIVCPVRSLPAETPRLGWRVVGVAALFASGCFLGGCGALSPSPRAVDLAGDVRVTFPYAPSWSVTRERVDGQDVLIGSARVKMGDDRFVATNMPTILSACVLQLDGAAFPTIDAGDRDAMVASLNEEFGRFGPVAEVTPMRVGGLPGFQVVIDRPRIAPRRSFLAASRSSFLSRFPLRTTVRVAVGRSSVAFFAVSYDRRRLGEEADALLSLDELVKGATFPDRPPTLAAGSTNAATLSHALNILSARLDS